VIEKQMMRILCIEFTQGPKKVSMNAKIKVQYEYISEKQVYTLLHKFRRRK
jgi:hypothetical protein